MSKKKTKKQNPSIIIQKPVKTPDINLYQFLLRRPKYNSCDILCRNRMQELSFQKMQADSKKYANTLAALGIQKGDIVPICSEPSIEAVILFFAINRMGAVSTFLNNTANSAEINYYIHLFSSKVLIVSQSTLERLKEDEVISEIMAEKLIAFTSEISTVKKQLGFPMLSELINEYGADNIPLDEEGKSAIAHISYTSGSTGQPKAILLTNENIMAEIISLRKATFMQLGPRENSLQVVPFNYPYGFIISTLLPIYCGKTAALSPDLTLNNISHYLSLYHPCYINAIPSFYKALMHDPVIQKMDLSFIRYPVTGGDTLDRKTEKAINAFLKEHGSKGKITNGCGNGEGCGSLLNPASVLRAYVPGSCGRPFPGLSVKLIDDETGLPVPLGDVGRFCFSGTNLMKGYYQNNSVEDSTFVTDEDGRRWFYTDTFMHMDEHQWMFMDGRERRFFITYDEHGSPYKVYCDYVQEMILKDSDIISDCAIVRREDAARSYVPIAYICLTDWAKRDPDVLSKIKDDCNQKLRSCEVPVDYYFLEELPLTIAGKVDYRTLEMQ